MQNSFARKFFEENTALFRNTVFFRNGGGLLLVLIIVTSLSITILLGPTLQTPTEPVIFQTTGTFEYTVPGSFRDSPDECDGWDTKCKEWHCNGNDRVLTEYDVFFFESKEEKAREACPMFNGEQSRCRDTGHGADCVVNGCTENADCSDGNTCTVDYCLNELCVHTPDPICSNSNPSPTPTPAGGSGGDACSGIPGYNPASMGCNINYYGGDFGAPFNDTLGGCQYACDYDVNCRAWTWEKGNGACWLKNVKNASRADSNTISGAKPGTGGGGVTPSPDGGGGSGTINVTFQCSLDTANAILTWFPDPNQLSLLVDIPPGGNIERTIPIGTGASGTTVTGLSPSSFVNFAVIGPGFESLRSNSGDKTPACGTGGGAAPTATTAPTARPTATTAPVNRPNPTATTAPAQPTATTAPNQPTATPTTGTFQTSIFLTFKLPGIGSNANTGQNPFPVRQELPLQIVLFDQNGNRITERNESAKFVSIGLIGQFQSYIKLDNINTGSYILKARLNNTLWKSSEIINLANGAEVRNELSLVSGDLDQNNELNLLDYNTLLSCYGAKSCGEKEKADLNLDGKVDEKDLNILYAEFATREGD